MNSMPSPTKSCAPRVIVTPTTACAPASWASWRSLPSASAREWFERLRLHAQLAGLPALRLPAHLVDRAAHHLADRIESGLLAQREGVDAQVGGEQRVGIGGELLEAVLGVERQGAPLRRGQRRGAAPRARARR